jgi:hypothetical protein
VAAERHIGWRRADVNLDVSTLRPSELYKLLPQRRDEWLRLTVFGIAQ